MRARGLVPPLLALLWGCEEPSSRAKPDSGADDSHVSESGDSRDSTDSAETGHSGEHSGTDSETADSGEDPAAAWKRFLELREGWLLELGEPILACVARTDTSHPVFHGCIDWHSAVHGTWALLVLGRLTGEETWTEVAEAALDPDALDQELLDLETGGLAAELPYGFSWFLVLARERERAGLEDLTPLAEAMAERLSDDIFSLSESQVRNRLLSSNYSNLSWEALNLSRWARHVGNYELEEQIEVFVREAVLPLSDLCPLEDETWTRNFFPPCLHLCRLVLDVLPEAESRAWLAGRVPEDWRLAPVTFMASDHYAGLNFSRSWGLYDLAEATSDASLRDLYVEHVETMMGMPEYWAKDYESYAHWVAQFGVYALALSLDEPL